MSNLFTTTLRFNLNREDDRRALEYLRSADGYSSYSRAVIAAINDHFSRRERMKDDPYLETREKEDAFLRRVQETIEKSLSAAPPCSLHSSFRMCRPKQHRRKRHRRMTRTLRRQWTLLTACKIKLNSGTSIDNVSVNRYNNSKGR